MLEMPGGALQSVIFEQSGDAKPGALDERLTPGKPQTCSRMLGCQQPLEQFQFRSDAVAAAKAGTKFSRGDLVGNLRCTIKHLRNVGAMQNASRCNGRRVRRKNMKLSSQSGSPHLSHPAT